MRLWPRSESKRKSSTMSEALPSECQTLQLCRSGQPAAHVCLLALSEKNVPSVRHIISGVNWFLKIQKNVWTRPHWFLWAWLVNIYTHENDNTIHLGFLNCRVVGRILSVEIADWWVLWEVRQKALCIQKCTLNSLYTRVSKSIEIHAHKIKHIAFKYSLHCQRADFWKKLWSVPNHKIHARDEKFHVLFGHVFT